MLEQLEKILENRTTVKYFDGNPIPDNIVDSIRRSVAQTPSCNNRYNFKLMIASESKVIIIPLILVLSIGIFTNYIMSDSIDWLKYFNYGLFSFLLFVLYFFSVTVPTPNTSQTQRRIDCSVIAISNLICQVG